MKPLKNLLKILVLIGVCQQAKAFSVSPMTANYQLFGKETSVVYTITNPSEQAVALEISVEARATSVDGKELNDSSAEIKKHFSIFPAATLIPPKQKKGIRVVYVGPKDLDLEKAYRINIVEKPQKDASGGSAVRMLREFRTAAYVAPKGTKADLKIADSAISAAGKLKLTFKNIGNAHQLVQKIVIKMKDDLGNTVTLNEKSDEKFLVNFLAGEERVIEIDKPSEIKGKALVGTIESVE